MPASDYASRQSFSFPLPRRGRPQKIGRGPKIKRSHLRHGLIILCSQPSHTQIGAARDESFHHLRSVSPNAIADDRVAEQRRQGLSSSVSRDKSRQP
jgi:hypothetical protein